MDIEKFDTESEHELFPSDTVPTVPRPFAFREIRNLSESGRLYTTIQEFRNIVNYIYSHTDSILCVRYRGKTLRIGVTNW